ncbi:MAG: hypothetical protein LUE64_03880 [Candidatus Gastranaerophilales bacterium]|nr:hypothetical protein [Candidatus Gastranaerophilales bacterium]
MKQILIIILLLLIIPYSSAKTADSRNFPVNADSMFMLSLSALNGLNFTIEEMQSSSGYILFKTPSGASYLLMVSSYSDNLSNVKIIKESSNAALAEIQDIVYNAISNEINNIPKRAL